MCVCTGFINERAAAAKAEAERLERERVETEIDRRPRHEAYLLKKTTTMSQDSMIFIDTEKDDTHNPFKNAASLFYYWTSAPDKVTLHARLDEAIAEIPGSEAYINGTLRVLYISTSSRYDRTIKKM